MNTDKNNKNKHFQAKTGVSPRVLLLSYCLTCFVVLSVFIRVHPWLNRVCLLEYEGPL